MRLRAGSWSSASNIVRMAFYLVVSLGGVAGLFFLAGADFVGALQLLVYVGGTWSCCVRRDAHRPRPVGHHEDHGGQWVLAAILGAVLLACRCRWRSASGRWIGPAGGEVPRPPETQATSTPLGLGPAGRPHRPP